MFDIKNYITIGFFFGFKSLVHRYILLDISFQFFLKLYMPCSMNDFKDRNVCVLSSNYMNCALCNFYCLIQTHL